MIEHARGVAARLRAHLPVANWVRMAEARARRADGRQVGGVERFHFKRKTAPYALVSRVEIFRLVEAVDGSVPPEEGDILYARKSPIDYGRHLRIKSGGVTAAMAAAAAFYCEENYFQLGRLAYSVASGLLEMVQFMRLLGIETNFNNTPDPDWGGNGTGPILLRLPEWDDFYAFVRGYQQSCVGTMLPPSILDYHKPRWDQPVGIREIFQVVGINDPEAYLAALKPLGWEEKHWRRPGS